MIFFILVPLYILANAYVIQWLYRWFAVIRTPFHLAILIAIMIIYCLFALSLLIAFLFPKRPIVHISNIWFAILPYILISVLLCDAGRVIVKHALKIDLTKEESSRLVLIFGIACMVIAAAITLYGFINAKVIRTVFYKLRLNKEYEGGKQPFRIALVADTHLGYNTGNIVMKQMVRKINQENPDLIVIAGDIFDNDYDALKYPDKVIKTLSKLKSRCGVYACYGNHDISEKILAGFTFRKNEKKESDIRMDEFLKKANIRLLKDEGVLLDNEIYLYGRPDAHRPNRDIVVRKTPRQITKDMDKTKPILVMDHQPSELQALADAGVDIDLSGHTHAGQMFPGALTIKFMWENAHGMIQKDNMYSIVTAGVGVFGPNMRLLARPEIAVIDVKFNRVQ